ncbi:hypothetical protein G7083_01795 [Vibrio sp. HDW18]|uniref:hypothetical protein n=1 Tax=Vibrio sp. HDW18 TaxID=2714948 RepID=UPI0014096290|nr:hypothetical protein [Vibrio sp. HDW18]QIL84759.1 hypothetical protein G7083_01795 [Vibrio sp. HDW18]
MTQISYEKLITSQGVATRTNQAQHIELNKVKPKSSSAQKISLEIEYAKKTTYPVKKFHFYTPTPAPGGR